MGHIFTKLLSDKRFLTEAAKISYFLSGPATEERGGGKGRATKEQITFSYYFLKFLPPLSRRVGGKGRSGRATKKRTFFCGLPNFYTPELEALDKIYPGYKKKLKQFLSWVEKLYFIPD